MAFLNGNQIFLLVLKFFKGLRLNKYQHTHGMLKRTPVRSLDKWIWLMTSTLLLRDTRVLYRPETKRLPDALFQVLRLLLTLNFVKYIRIAKENYKWRHHDCHKTWWQFADQIQKWGPDLVSQVFCLQLLWDVWDWQKSLINDTVMTVTWSEYNLQTRYKTRNRFNISGSPRTTTFKFFQIC